MTAMILTSGGWTEDTREEFEYSCARRHIYDHSPTERYTLGMDRSIALCADCAHPS